MRLLYVAMTRAKNWLCLSSYEEEGESQHKRGRSPFLERGYIPSSLLESVETLESVLIPPSPPETTVPVPTGETAEYIEPLPEKLLGDGMTVLGIDPGIQNVGWSITKKSPVGYTVIKYGTQTTRNWQETLILTRNEISELITRHRPDAIAVEKLDGATEEWFRYVAGCVATIRNIADQHGIECRLYTPQEVKAAATGNRNACKVDVQKGVKSVCNLPQIPEPHHSADAIATSLCYLRNYLNSARFEGNKRKQEHYEVGCDYLDRKQYEKAINTFKETINIDPVYTDAHYELGRAYLVQNDLDRAETAAKTALRLGENNHPDSQKLLGAITHYRSGCNFLNISKSNIAIAKFRESINLEPIFTEAHCGLSRAYFEVNKLEAAKKAAEEALKLRYEYPPAQELLVDIKKRYYYNGKICFNREEYTQAIFEFQKAVEIDQNFKGAHRFIGETYLKLEDLEKSEKSARDALQIDSTYQPAVELLGEIKQKHKERGDDYRKRKACAKAVKSYQQAIRIDDKYKKAYNNLGMVYQDMKEYSKAIRAYQQAISIDERYQVPHNNLGMVYHKIGEHAKAVNSLQCAIVINPDYQTAHHNLAFIYFEMGNLQDASKKVVEASKLDTNNQNTLRLLKDIQRAYSKQGRDYFRRGDLAAAEISVKEALTLTSNYQPAYKLLDKIKQAYYKHGLTSLKQNEWKAAEKFAEEVLRIDPNYEPANELLKQAYYEQSLVHIENDRYVEGISKLQKSKDIDPNCEKTLYYLGFAYFKLDRLKEAQMMTEEALLIQSNYPLAQKLLIEIKDARNWLKVGGAKVRELARWIVNRIGL
ncbi:tetratricopeptide repeat protein [Candidatus Poribacteria bacterium]|nr:tetratricopeptide repeat protein [Candidatus Poribacteria bacterium]